MGGHAGRLEHGQIERGIRLDARHVVRAAHDLEVLAQAQPRQVSLHPRPAGGRGHPQTHPEPARLVDVLAHAGQDGLGGDQRVGARAMAPDQGDRVDRPAQQRLEMIAGIEGVGGADALGPAREVERVAVLGVDGLPDVVDRRLGVEDETVEVEDDQPHATRPLVGFPSLIFTTRSRLGFPHARRHASVRPMLARTVARPGAELDAIVVGAGAAGLVAARSSGAPD